MRQLIIYGHIMKKKYWQIILGITLIASSAGMYLIHYMVFHDAHHIWIYLVGDIAFLPIEVLLVSMVIHGLLEAREKRAMINKLNMVVGAFFSEVGTGLLRKFFSLSANRQVLKDLFLIKGSWTDKDFRSAINSVRNMNSQLQCNPAHYEDMRDFLVQKRGFLLGLLENPNLLEHEEFTDLLWAILHFSEELTARDNLHAIPDSDAKHLIGDLQRAYNHLIITWLKYMKHLKSDYPYLFSLAVRLNPFDDNTDASVRN